MKLLLDTHTFIWWDSAPERLSQVALDALSDESNELLLSDASVWEMIIKTQLKKLSWNIPFDVVLAQHEAAGMRRMPIERSHLFATAGLPLLHRDPFDRLLISTANIESASIVSVDPEIRRYKVNVIW